MRITDSKGLLSLGQMKLLQDAASLPFSLGSFNSLDDVLSTLRVDVHVEPGILKHPLSDFNKEAEDFWRKKMDAERKKQAKAIEEEKSPDYSRINEIERIISEIRNSPGPLTMLGCYKPTENIIVLYPDAMKATDASKMDELLVSVLAHETMHAYFNRPGHEMYPYAPFVEEPLAEFGMLLYLHETISPYESYAYGFVKGKRSCYRYGADIFDAYMAGNSFYRRLLEGYKIEMEGGCYAVFSWHSFRYPSAITVAKKGLSKSKYTLSRQCQKALWLEVYGQRKKTIDPNRNVKFEQGEMVGNLARSLFGAYVDVTVKVGAGNLDLGSMIQRTNECLKGGVENICEASFSFNDALLGLNYCAVDILHKTDDGYDIYEVKSGTEEVDNDKNEDDGDEKKKEEEKLKKYTLDISYQKWVLEKCGVKVNNCFLIRVNKNYVRKGVLSIPDLFVITDMSGYVAKEYPNMETNVLEAQRTLACLSEPKVNIGMHCDSPYKCAFKDYCFKDVPKPSVLELYYMHHEKRWNLFNSGKRLFSDLKKGEYDNSKVRNRQVAGLPYVDKDGIGTFLKKIKYPLYFLDFETMMFAIPPYDGLKPYQQIPFQYSLHFQQAKGGTLYHTEYLAESGVDPRIELAERLCKDIPLDSCVVAYNKSFEEHRLRELAALFPHLSAHLTNIADHLVDLIEPFRGAHYYLPAMGGSLSIKSVLPALFPDDPQFDYHNLLGGVQNGGDAMTVFPKIKDMQEPQKSQTRKALLDYCKLDTLAMVKILEKLYDAVK